MLARWDIQTRDLQLVVTYTNLQTGKVYDCGVGPVSAVTAALTWVASELMPLETVYVNGVPHIFPAFNRRTEARA